MTAPTAAEIARAHRRAAVELLRLVFKYGDARAGKALHNGDEQQVSCDCARSAIEDAILAALAAAEADRASAVQAAYRECAALCEELGVSGVQCDDGEWSPFDDVYGGRQATEKCAAAIRARGTVRPTDSERKEGD